MTQIAIRIMKPNGTIYDIYSDGSIALEGADPSNQWKMLGLSHVKRSEFIPFSQLAEKLPSLTLLYKNGRPQYTVRDLDHGTKREWGNTHYHGVQSISIA